MVTPMTNSDYFVPDGTFDSREATATALVGAADEFRISQRAVRATQGGFWITEELATVVFNDSDQTGETPDGETPDGEIVVEGADEIVVEDGDKTADDNKDNSGDPENETPVDDQSSEEQTDKAPAKKSRSKK